MNEIIVNKEVNKRKMYHNFIHLAWPVAAQGFLLEFLSTIDLVMAGSLGADVQAAIGVVSQPKMMLLIFAKALSISVTAVVARRFGERNYDGMTSVLKQSLTLVIAIYLILISLSFIFFEKIMLFTGAKEMYLDLAVTYGRIIFMGSLFSVVSMILSSALVAVGKTKIIFLANIIGNVVNCILNYIFIFGKFGAPKLGIFGLSLATFIGMFITFLIITFSVQKKGSILKLNHKNWCPDRNTMSSIAKITTGTLPEQIFERIGMYLYTMMVVKLGVIQLAIHHICMNLCDIFYSFAIGLGTATSATTGRMLGEEDIVQAVEYGKIGQKIGFIVAMIGFIVFTVFSRPIISLFTNDIEVIDLGSKILKIVGIVSFPQTISLVNSGVLKGAGDTKYVAKYSLIIIAILRPTLTYFFVFVLDMGLFGAWLSLLIDQCLRAIAATLRFNSMKWSEIAI